MTSNQDYMSQALKLAELGRYTVSPNPMVGCILVKNDQIVGSGFHQKAGDPHAEIIALKEAGEKAKGSTAYVTLEPCCHFGRTPPCTDTLIQAGIQKVFVAVKDPNPLVAGNGINALRAANIEVEVGLLEKEAAELNEIFFHYIRHKRPFVISKWAMSLDGKTITAKEDTRQISSLASQEHTHDLRHQVDAILIGATTAITDNPLLTVRLNHKTIEKHPLRIVLAGKKVLPSDLKLWDETLPAKTLVVTANPDSVIEVPKHIEILHLPSTENGQVNLTALLENLGQREITSLLVEGGMTVHHSFFKENLVQKTHVYVAPVIIGSLAQKKPLQILESTKLGSDHFIQGVAHV